MNFSNLKPLIFTAIAVIISFTATSCGPGEDEFAINGTIGNAQGNTLYLLKDGMNGITVLDSAKLDNEGEFEFIQKRPASFEFYLITIKGKGVIPVEANSASEEITVTADAGDFTGSYSVSGSTESALIKEIATKASEVDEQVQEMIKNSPPERLATVRRIDSVRYEFKEQLAKEYILPAPGSISAYYALHLNVGGAPLYRPMEDRQDSKCFAAVATSMQKTYPNSKRVKALSEVAEKGMRMTRTITEEEINALNEKVVTNGSFNISLPDRTGNATDLSSLTGKVVLLDFTVYGDERVLRRNIALDELYDKYSGKGFSIYQISYDTHIHFWKEKAKEYPWVCVHDAEGNASYNLRLYNVTSIPTFFLLNRSNEVVLRDVQIEDVEKEIEKLLDEQQ